MTTTTEATPMTDPTTWSGYRSHARNRETGTLVVVIDQHDGWIDPDSDDNRWATVCDDHSTITSHPTLALARYHAASPMSWCEMCAGTEPDDDDESTCWACDGATDETAHTCREFGTRLVVDPDAPGSFVEVTRVRYDALVADYLANEAAGENDGVEMEAIERRDDIERYVFHATKMEDQR